jgi:hypothetical protein
LARALPRRLRRLYIRDMEANCRKRFGALPRGASRQRGAMHAATLVAAGVCAGCWEEVPHQSQPPGAVTSGEEPDAEQSTDAPDVEPPAPAADDPAAALTASELFGDEPAPPPLEAAVVDPPTSIDDPVVDDGGDEAIVVEPAEELAGETPAAEVETSGIAAVDRFNAWSVASAWSLAAGVAAKGLDADKYEPFLAEARRAAEALGVELPPLPTIDDPNERVAETITELRNESGAKLVAALSRRVDPAAGKAARLAIDSHLLLLWYTQSGADAISASVAIQAAGEASDLPPELWQPLVDLLNERANYLEVRAAVFELHGAVAEHFSGQ